VGNEQEISILNLAERVRDLAGSKSEIRFIPRKEAYAEDFQETVRRRPCLKKFNRMTNFKHAWTLDKTLLDLIQKERFRISKEKQVG
jgi:UDP-glucose 4-epimerase